MKFIILGCGSSMGVPRTDGYFGNCKKNNKKNYRTRCSALLQTKKENILFDSSPDLRNQLLTNNINNVDRVFYSHMHADQTHGINDLRIFYLKRKKPLHVYADSATSRYLSKTFSYCFKKLNNGYPVTLKMNKIKKIYYIKDGQKNISLKPVSVNHGDVDSICYIIGKKLAYISDVKKIYQKDKKFFKNLEYLIIDCLWLRGHPSHLNFNESISLIKDLSPKKAILTNLHSDLDYNWLKKRLPKNITPAYDGYTIKL